jgi:hypothetical protein
MKLLAWRPLTAIAAVHFLLHMVTAGNYGIFRDEYYYLACARHLAWGYVDQPPLSIAVLALVRAVLGEGMIALRLVPALCGASLIVLSGFIAASMGGRRFAQVLAGLSMAIPGVVQVITGFYSMNALDLVFWALAWVTLVAWINSPRPRTWLLLGLIMGLGLMNKVGLLVMGAALAISLLATGHRRVLATRWPYIAGAIAAVIFLPHLVWQAAHGWPTLEFIETAQRYKITSMSPLAFLVEVVLEQHPTNLSIWVLGLGWLLFAACGRRYRLLGLMFMIGLVLLMLQRAKPYYAAGLFPILLAAGACAWESIARRPKLGWLRPVLLIMLLANGLFFLPMGVPILGIETYERFQEWTGIAPAAQEVGHTHLLPQHYSDRFGWKELAEKVSDVADKLPPEEQANLFVLARNYGQASALEYWSRRNALPPVFSGHNSYYFWLPEDRPMGTAIVVGWSEEEIRKAFNEVTLVGTITNRWAQEGGTPIWVAREPTLKWKVVRESIRAFG